MNRSVPEFLQDFYYHLYRITFRVNHPFEIPGNTQNWVKILRGALHAGVSRVWCREPREDGIPCETCSCLYRQIFSPEWKGENEAAGRFGNPPAPLILNLEESIQETNTFVPGQEISFRLVLFGEFNRNLPWLVPVLSEMPRFFLFGAEALGLAFLEEIIELDPNQQSIQHVFQGGEALSTTARQAISLKFWEEVPEGLQSLSIHIPDMLILKEGGEFASKISLELLLNRLLGRLALLSSAHCRGRWEETRDLAQALAEGATVLGSDLIPVEWAKYDSPRGKGVQGNRNLRANQGVKGWVKFATPKASQLFPLLALGEVVGIGKHTAMGLGTFQTSAHF